VLVTGGARGITALAAIELAKRFRCTIELVGRSPLPADADIGGDAPAIRKALIARGLAPAEIERTIARTLAAREIRATLDAIRAAGSQVTYHAVDVRDAAFGALIDDIYARCGRLDGVIHGAGVLEDKLIRDKTGDSFERVVRTKLGSALTLADKLRPDAKFVAWFASISGVAGNRGQVDYAAANDALDKLAWALCSGQEAGPQGSMTRGRGTRVVSVDWGPWAGAGMVTPELAREYARRGIGLIDPAAGVDALLAELGDGGDAQVVLTAATPQMLRREAKATDQPRAEPSPRADA
jgi:NAD(P)-dependent dehydrogenase (short-subunit alcohol dehydrogenase family)